MDVVKYVIMCAEVRRPILNVGSITPGPGSWTDKRRKPTEYQQ